MNLIERVGCAGLTQEECGEGIAVASPVRGIRCCLVGPERKASGRATASASDFADERKLVILNFSAEVEAGRAMLPVKHVVQCNCVVHILRIVVLAKTRIRTADEYKSGKDRTGAVGDSQCAVPVFSPGSRCRQVVVVGAVAADGQRINQPRGYDPIPSPARQLAILIDRAAAGWGERGGQIRAVAMIDVFAVAEEAPDF